MILKCFKRKLHNVCHPVVGEIWMLHRVVKQRSDLPEQRELEVTLDWLEHKIEKYKQQGYTFISIDSIFNSHFSIPNSRPWVCLTLDDGYHDNYTYAYPLLKRMGIPFTLYITTGFIDNKLPIWWYPNEKLGILGSELQAMDVDPLCTIGAHTVSHPKLDSLTYEQQQQEIADCIHDLKKMLNHPIHHFSLPHGAYSADTLKICKELGIRSIVTSWGGSIRRGKTYNPYPRVNIVQS